MDDWLILAKKRWQLKKAIKRCNQILNKLKLTKHPDKSFIGYIKKGFDFCGFKYNHNGIIHLANKTLRQYQQRLAKLYEQPAKLLQYQKNFSAWVKGSCPGGVNPYKPEALVGAPSLFPKITNRTASGF